jgi:toxin ParE1/3/4
VTAGVRRWSVRLTATAENDFREILRWTLLEFGERQSRIYAETLSAALKDLAVGPSIAGVKRRDEIAKGMHSLHVARKGRKGRHFVMFRVVDTRGDAITEVLRLLHDAMDLPRHLPSADERE